MNTSIQRARVARFSALLLLVTAAVTQSPAEAREPTANSAHMEGSVELLPNGDGRAKLTIDLHPAPYTQMKRAYPNPQQFLREFASSRSNFEMAPGATVEYDDRRSAIHIKMIERGGIVGRGNGRWTLEIDPAADYVATTKTPDGRTVMHFYEVGSWGNGVTYRGAVRYMLPEGAKEDMWNERSRELMYTLPRGDGSGPASITVNLQSKQRIMSAVYKVYGFGADFSGMWLGKGMLENTGKSVIKNLKVRYKLGEYSDWSSWTRYAELVPSQMVCCNYYPVLKSSVAQLTSNTPVDLQMEWTYEDIGGTKHEDSTGERVTLLGGHEFVFSNVTQGESIGAWHESTNNAPLIAAWASRDDMVVKQFASMANKNAAGVGASSSNKNALQVLEAIYNMMRINDFTYQHPPGMVDKSTSFDVQMIQNIKYPRDVIRDRSGTCIDLAILYAAMANAVGLKPYLALIPGHCFPVIRLPGGQMIGIEATGIQGGLRHGSASFEKVVEYGIKELADSQKDGRIHLIDVQDMWTRGIANPELPRLPADILNQWKITTQLPQKPNAPLPAGTNQPAQPQQPPPTQPQPKRKQSSFIGTWGGNVTEQLDTGGQITYPLVLTIRAGQQPGTFVLSTVAIATVPTPQGNIQARAVQQFNGRLNGTQLVFQGTSKSITANGITQNSTPDNGTAHVVNGMLTGRSGNNSDGYTSFSFQRR